MDVYVDPVLPAPVLYVFGATPAARALVDLGAGAGWAVVAVDPEHEAADVPRAERVLAEIDPAAEPARTASGRFAIVATQGQWDERAILAALALEPDWIGTLASRRRFAEMKGVLLDRGADPAALEVVEAPAGLDLGATRPEEIALSVLARLVEVRHGAGAREEADAGTGTDAAAAEAAAVDPVCGMTVEPGPGVPSAEHAGETYLFCCGGCREKFLAEPERWLAAAG